MKRRACVYPCQCGAPDSVFLYCSESSTINGSESSSASLSARVGAAHAWRSLRRDKTVQRSEPRLLPRLIILRSEPLADRRRSADRSRARPPSNGVELGIVGPARSRFDRHVRMAIPRLPSGRRPPLPMKLWRA